MLSPGDRVDQFSITRAIGRGGMGEVFLARDVHLGRRVAIKVVHPQRLGSPEALDRFLAEARITAQFSHPHIVAVYAAGLHRGSPYLALEYLEGQNLRQRLREGRPGAREAQRIALAIAEALREAHAHGILHRDLKPENVLIPRDGRLRVVDFGIAQRLGDAGGASGDPGASPRLDEAGLATAAAGEPPGEEATAPTTAPSGPARTPADDDAATVDDRQLAAGPAVATRTDATGDGGAQAGAWLDSRDLQRSIGAVPRSLAGTPRYMAPEQWLGRELTGAVDVWALGLILYELLAGRLPYSAPTAVALAVQVVAAEAVPALPLLAEVPRELADLVMRCLAKDPTARPSAAQVVEALGELLQWGQLGPRLDQSPFRGLLPFDERHTAFFHGRDAEIATFLERLREQCVLPLVGHSGAGKSSFIQAGVLPRLREQGPWVVLHLRPGERPFHTLASRLRAGESTARGTAGSAGPGDDADEAGHTADMRAPRGATAAPPGESVLDEAGLAASLREAPATLALRLQQIAEREGARVLLLVDQLEELCTLVDDELVQQRFMQAICSAADDPRGPVRVCFTLRDDFLSRLATGPEARAALGQVTVLRHPDQDALRAILQRPLQAVGHRFGDPRLVDEMVAEVQGEPACLPLLQFAMSMLWERRDRTARLITRDSYRAIGGVAGALALHADGVLDGLPADAQLVARDLLLRLVTADGTRRVLTRARALEGLGPGADEVLGRLTQARLVSVRRSGREGEAEPVLELVHESLIRHWGRLARWIEEGRDQVILLADVAQAAERWDRLGRRHDELLRGQALHDAARALQRSLRPPPALVQDYIGQGLALQQRTRRRQRLGVVGLAVIAVVALLMAAAFADQRSKARQRSDELRVQWATAQREGARAALLRGDLLEARARLRMSLEAEDSTFARALWWRLGQDPLSWSRHLEATIEDVAFSPDGRTVAGASQDRTIYLFDATTQDLRVLRGFDDQLLSLAYRPDGHQLAVGSWDGSVHLVALDGSSRASLRGHEGAVWSVGYSPDGRWLASAGGDGSVRLWEVARGTSRAVLRDHEAAVEGLAFSPDGRWLASASWDRTVKLWDLATDPPVLGRTLEGHAREATTARFSSDGALLATASYDATVRLWELPAGRLRAELRGHSKAVRDLRFVQGDRQLVTASADGSLRLWDTQQGRPLRTLGRHGDRQVTSLGLGPDGRWLASCGEDGSVRVWDLASRGALPDDHGHRAELTSVAFAPGGAQLASSSYDKTIRLWDVASGEQTATLEGHTDTVFRLAYSPDGARLASSSYDKTIRLWAVATGRELRLLTGHAAMVDGIAFSPDGRRLASGSYDNSVRLWDVESGRELRQLLGHEDWVTGVAFSADGGLLASASYDETVRLWDARSGAPRRVLRGHQGEVNDVAFSPDGRWLASGGADRQLRLWDLAGGRARVLGQHEGRIHQLAFTPDGARLASVGADGSARLWRLDGAAGGTLGSAGAELNGLAVAPDGRLLATAGDDGAVQLWQLDTGQPFWRGVALLGAPQRVFTHRGWQVLDAGVDTALARPSPLEQVIAARALHVEEAADGRTLCLRERAGGVELWDPDGLQPRRRVESPGSRDLVALPGACALRTADEVLVLDADREQHLALPARALAAAGDRLLVATADRVWSLAPHTGQRDEFPADDGATALLALHDAIAIGYRDGNIEFAATRTGRSAPAVRFEGLPASAVARLVSGPPGTLVAGFESGLVGIWSLDNGARLHASKLHGRIQHLRVDGTHLHALSALGDRLVLELATFTAPRCELLRQVWQATPVRWDRGAAQRAEIPRDHPCAVAP